MSLTASNINTFIYKINRRNRKKINECHKQKSQLHVVTFDNIVTNCNDLLGNIFIKYTK